MNITNTQPYDYAARPAAEPSLSPDQRDAVAAIERHIKANSGAPFLLNGLAGTGKTTVLAKICKRHRCDLAAPTAKAASVLAAKTGQRALTLHSLIYDFRGEDMDAGGRLRPVFELKSERERFNRRIVVVDESSMVGARLGRDLVKTNAIIIAAGDPGQLPPVRDEPFFQNADFTLKTIHRQAAESAIIRQAHRVRSGRRYEADGPDFRVVDLISDTELLHADMILCHRNRTRAAINKRVRHLRGYGGNPQAGEPVLALRNAHAQRVFNGETYRLRAPIELGPLPVLLRSPAGTDISVDACFAGIRRPLDAPPAVTELDFAYAMTVHKSQGSEWPSVVVIDEHPPGPDRDRWLYSGITRASKRIVIGRRLAR